VSTLFTSQPLPTLKEARALLGDPLVLCPYLSFSSVTHGQFNGSSICHLLFYTPVTADSHLMIRGNISYATSSPRAI